MFPEIRAAIKEFARGFSSEPVTLGLGAKGLSGFMDVDQSNADWLAHQGFRKLAGLTGGSRSWAGEIVSIQSALNHSVVWACNRIISESVAFLPLVMMQSKGGRKEVAEKHPMYTALHDAPNEEMTAMSFRETRTSDCVMQGDGFAQISRRSGTGVAVELRPLLYSQVDTDREKTGQKRLVYLVKDGNSQPKTFTVARGKPHDILHIRGIGNDGVRGYSVLSMARQSIGTAIGSERNVANFYAQGGRLPYNLKLNQKFKDDETANKFRADWERVYAQPHTVPILEPWFEYQTTGISLKDAQLLETRLFHIHEICRWFLVSPHLVGDLSRATFSNIEQLAMEFVKMTLSTWITRWEQELWRCVLTPEEKAQGYFFKHNLNALLRGDFASRMAGYSTMLQNGISSINEVRDLEDWNPCDGGDAHHIQLNQQTVPGSGAPLTARDGSLVRLGSN